MMTSTIPVTIIYINDQMNINDSNLSFIMNMLLFLSMQDSSDWTHSTARDPLTLSLLEYLFWNRFSVKTMLSTTRRSLMQNDGT